MAPRRTISSFSLSFLDIMFCGFGAVVLLVLIINTNIVSTRQEHIEDRRLEFMQQQIKNNLAEENLTVKEQELSSANGKIKTLENERALLLEDIHLSQSSTIPKAQEQSSSEQIKRLQAELKALDEQKQELEAQRNLEQEPGQRTRTFIGEGNRQYLTGLRLGGKRILILVDVSASMLDRKIIDIIRLKILDDATRRTAPKWQKTLSTVEWIIANLPNESAIRLISFNNAVSEITPETQRSWVNLSDNAEIDSMVAKIRQLAPIGGTNLEAAFQNVRAMTPRPDNIILLTDGLPTQGVGTPRLNTVSGERRAKLFEKAVKQLPGNIPINIILFPVEGDPMASVLFWKLAIDSGGSFLTPTRDWP